MEFDGFDWDEATKRNVKSMAFRWRKSKAYSLVP